MSDRTCNCLTCRVSEAVQEWFENKDDRPESEADLTGGQASVFVVESMMAFTLTFLEMATPGNEVSRRKLHDVMLRHVIRERLKITPEVAVLNDLLDLADAGSPSEAKH